MLENNKFHKQMDRNLRSICMKKILLVIFFCFFINLLAFANWGPEVNLGVGGTFGMIESYTRNNYTDNITGTNNNFIISGFLQFQSGLDYRIGGNSFSGATLLDMSLGFGLPTVLFNIGIMQDFYIGNFMTGLGLGYTVSTGFGENFRGESISGMGNMYVRLVLGYNDRVYKIPIHVDLHIPTSNKGFGFGIGFSYVGRFFP